MTDVRTAGVLAALCLPGAASGEAQSVKPDELLARGPELRLGNRSSPISIVTLYKFDEELGIHVPVEMRDWYPDGTGEIRGVATCGRFRRFQVRTTEEVQR